MRIWTLFVFAGLLAACSGHTIYRFEVDILSFIPEDQRTRSVTLVGGQGQVLLPDQKGQRVDLPGVEALVGGGIEAALEVTNSASSPLTASLEVWVGPADDQDLFDENEDIRWGRDEINLEPGKTGSISLDLSLDPSNPDVYTLVKGGSFRIGLKIAFSGGEGSVQYTWQAAQLTLRLKPFNLIPNP